MKTSIAVTALLLLAAVPAQAKSLAACNAEYASNKAKIDGAQSEADFVASCQGGQDAVPGATTAAIPAVPPAVANKQPATPAKSAGEAVKPAAAP